MIGAVVVAVVGAVAAQAEVPAAWVCDPATYVDGVCDCGCGAVDDDCSAAIACARVHCAEGVDVDDTGAVCLNDDDDDGDGDGDGGCASGAAGVALLLPGVRRRRR